MAKRINTESTQQKRDMFWILNIGIAVLVTVILLVVANSFMLKLTPMLIAIPLCAACCVIGSYIVIRQDDDGGGVLFLLAAIALAVGCAISGSVIAKTETIVHNPTQVIKTPNKIVLFSGDQMTESSDIPIYTAKNPKLCQDRYWNCFGARLNDKWYGCTGGSK